MKRLELFEKMTAEIQHRLPAKTHIGAFSMDSETSIEEQTASARVKVQFDVHLRSWSVCENTDNGLAQAKSDAAFIMARHVYNDIKNELFDLFEFAIERDEKIARKIQRLIDMADGRNVFDD